MRTPETEIEKILGALDGHFSAAFEGTNIADSHLVKVAFTLLLEQATAGANLEEIMVMIFSELVKAPKGGAYLQHVLKACAHCASATLQYRSGKEVGAWQQLVDATAEAGVALAIAVAGFEKIHQRKEISSSGGIRKAQKNAQLKKFVEADYLSGKHRNPAAAGAAIAKRFYVPHQNPELRLEDFESNLSLDRLAKTIEEWIRKLSTKTDAYQASG